jgi:hypothetical protein
MKIRIANRFDLPDVIDMLRDYRDSAPCDAIARCNNEEYIIGLFSHILAGMGKIFLAEKNDLTVGMLVAIRNNNIWDPDIYQLDELAFWVSPEHRGSTAGYKLLKAYQKYGEELKQQGKIVAYTISKLNTSPDLDYARFGFELLEQKWRI